MKGQHKDHLAKYKVIKKHHKFLRDSDSEQDQKEQKGLQKALHPQHSGVKDSEKSESQLAKQYYQSLFKEFAIVDLSQYESGKIGCRWRTQKQVLKKKGQAICGATKCKNPSITVFQMNFGYIEHGVKHNALVKVSVCEPCGVKLNWTKKLKEVAQVKKEQE